MKLLTKTSLHYSWVNGIILVSTLVLLFFILKYNISSEIREQLELQAELVAYEIKEGNEVQFPLVKVEPLSVNSVSLPVFKDTLIFDPLQQETENYYLLRKRIPVNDKAYQVTVVTTYIGWLEYLKAIVLIFIVLAIAMTGGGVLVNYYASKKLWKPFLQNLDRLKQFSFKSNETVKLVASDINEFEDLNRVLDNLMEQSRKEYHSLQEFTENASHELQTPISIIRSQLERLSQHHMDNDAADVLLNAKETLNRLSKVNKALLLLAKLERDNFPDLQSIKISDILNDLLADFTEIFADKNIEIDKLISPTVIVCSPHLINILLSNLLSNIHHHTPPGGKASIYLNHEGMAFRNEGAALQFPETDLFKRFQKGNTQFKGVGLGLSIAKQICLVHQWKLAYSYKDGQHAFEITFHNC